MRVLETNPSRGEVKLRIEDEEDVWTFYSILREGDMIRARTARSVSGSSGKEKIPMTLTIKVTGAEFQPFSGVLRVKGIIVEGPDRFGLKGAHHSIKVYPGRELVLIREKGLEQLLEKLKKASERKPKVPILAIDYDEYALAIVRGQGIEWAFEGALRLPGKGDENREKALEKTLNELVKRVEEELKARDLKTIIVVGPGFLKDKVAEKLKERGFEVKVDSASMGGRAGVLEAIRKGTLKNLREELESVKAMEYLEEFAKHIGREDNLALYGLEDCLFAAKANAIKTLLIVDSLIHSLNDEEREKATELVEEAEKRGAEVIIVPKDTEAGERLWALGGVICLLRYPLEV